MRTNLRPVARAIDCPERSLADAGRADQAQNRRLQAVDALLYGEILDDPFLDLFQAPVIGIENLSGCREILADARPFAPRQTDQRLDEIAHHRRFGRHRRHQPELPEFCQCLGESFLAHSGSLDLLVEFLEVGAFFAFAEFLLDRLDLLVEVVLALALLHLALDAPADALLDLQDVDLRFELRQQALDARADIEHLEDFLLLLELQRQVCGNRVGQTTSLFDAGDRGQDFRRNLLVELDVLVELSDHRTPQRLDLMIDAVISQHRRERAKNISSRDSMASRRARCDTFDQHLDRPVGKLQHLQDIGHTANVIQVLGFRFVLHGRLLGDEQDALARFHRHFKSLDRLRPPNEKRNHHVRENHHVAQRQQRQFDWLGSQLGGCRHRLCPSG
jgi:hypothetical protein